MRCAPAITTSAIALGALALASCSKPNDATPENISKAITSYLADAAFYCMGTPAFPTDYQDLHPDGDGSPSNPTLRNFYYLGLIAQQGERSSYNQWYWHARFGLTKQGLDNFVSGKGFCFGKPALVTITNFSEPANRNGHIVTDVQFTYKMVDVPSMVYGARGVEFLRSRNISMFPNIPLAGTTAGKTITLAQTNSGWVEEGTFLGQR